MNIKILEEALEALRKTPLAFGTEMRLAASVKKGRPLPHLCRSAVRWDRHPWRCASGEEVQIR
jgi:hypothetical protein